jgi:amidase
LGCGATIAAAGAWRGIAAPVLAQTNYDIVRLSAVELAAAIRQRIFTSQEVVRAFLKQIEAVNPALNAVVQLRAEVALEEAKSADDEALKNIFRGPLHGVPMTIKDSLDTADLITTAGTSGRAHFLPSQDATVVARLRNAGAILLGKTNTPELTLGGETENAIYGRTNNPYDLERTPGGSSGGPAAIVAAYGSPFDIGSDTGGSIRWPAHCCGIAGFKPTSVRVSRYGSIISYVGLMQSLTQLGPIARSVDDLELLLRIIAGEDNYDPFVTDMPIRDSRNRSLAGLRVAYHLDNGLVTPTDDIKKTVRNIADLMHNAGAIITEITPPAADGAENLFTKLIVGDPSWIDRLLAKSGTTDSPLPEMARSFLPEPMSLADYSELVEELDRYRSAMHGFMREFDLILSPAAPAPAPLHGKYNYENTESYLIPYNLVGWPAAVIRGGTSVEGLPLGVQIAGRPWRSDLVLAAARHIEAELGRWPSSDKFNKVVWGR